MIPQSSQKIRWRLCRSGFSRVVLSLGKDADRVLGGFDSKFINYELNGSSSKNVTVWSDKGSSTEYKKVSVADISVYGAQVNDALGGVSVLDTGYGRVVVVPYQNRWLAAAVNCSLWR